MSRVEIEVATPDDWQRVREIRLAALADAPDAFGSTLRSEQRRPRSAWRGWLGRDRSVTLVARVTAGAGDPRDAGLARIGPWHAGQDVAGLYSMWVAPWARGAGASDALLEAAVQRAAALGYARLLLEVGDHNHRAIALYERFGFAPTGRTTTLPAPRDHITEHERALDLPPSV